MGRTIRVTEEHWERARKLCGRAGKSHCKNCVIAFAARDAGLDAPRVSKDIWCESVEAEGYTLVTSESGQWTRYIVDAVCSSLAREFDRSETFYDIVA